MYSPRSRSSPWKTWNTFYKKHSTVERVNIHNNVNTISIQKHPGRLTSRCRAFSCRNFIVFLAESGSRNSLYYIVWMEESTVVDILEWSGVEWGGVGSILCKWQPTQVDKSKAAQLKLLYSFSINGLQISLFNPDEHIYILYLGLLIMQCK